VTTDVSPTAFLTWTQSFTSDVRHVDIRVGQGELLNTLAGSACLIDGHPVTQGGAAQGIEALAGTGAARLYTQVVPVTATTYGVTLPASRLTRTDDGEVYFAALSIPTDPRGRFSFTLLPGVRTLSAQVTGADILSNIGTEGLAQLVMTAILTTGETVIQTFDVRVDGTPPTGALTYSRALGFGYLASRGLSDDAVTFTFTYADGSTHTEPVSSNRSGVQLVNRAGSPVTVTATDAAGNVSGNLLTRSTVAGRENDGNRTVFASWPLPAYLDRRRPMLAALLTAFEVALNVGPERAGDALSLYGASGADLNGLVSYYGIYRRPGESDAGLTARAQARFLPRKSTRDGLTVQLTSAGAAGVQVIDGNSLYAGARILDGSWKLDGSVRLGGTPNNRTIDPGSIIVLFSSTPAGGWDAARIVTGRHTAAGVIAHLELQVSTQVALGNASRTDLHYDVATTALSGTIGSISDSYFAHPLLLDGTWTLGGAEEIDGNKNGA
jgi:hypothetical protein